eukprot:Em0012g441a
MATTTKPYKLFHVPTHRVGVYLCQPGTQRHAWILNTGGVTTTNKYYKLTNGDGCHSCELQSTLRQTLSCSMYPQGRCVPVPTKDPTSRADPEH